MRGTDDGGRLTFVASKWPANIGVVDAMVMSDAEFLHISGITLGLSASCFEIGARAMEAARRGGARVTFDVNYRRRLWPPDAAAEAVRSVAPQINVLVCTREVANVVEERPELVANLDQ